MERASAGSSNEARMPMIAITTSNSMSVNPDARVGQFRSGLVLIFVRLRLNSKLAPVEIAFGDHFRGLDHRLVPGRRSEPQFDDAVFGVDVLEFTRIGMEC